MPIENVFEIDVDIKQKTAIRTPTVTQNDAVVFIFRIFDEGRIYNIQSGSTFTMTSTRPDKQAVMTVGTIAGENIVQFELGTTEIAVVGKVETVIQVYDADGRVSTIPFSFNVLNDPTGDYIPSEDEQTLIQKVLGEGPAILADAKRATTDADTASTNANEKAELAQTAAGNANTAATNASGAATNAEEKAALAEDKAALADTAAQGANIAKTAAETATQEAQEATQAINLVLPNVEGLEYVEPYNTATNYNKNNIVSHEGSSFISLVDDNLGNNPSLNPNAFWGVLARKGTDGLGSVVTVNGIAPDENGNVTLIIPDPDLSGLATKEELQEVSDKLTKTNDLSIDLNRGVQIVTVKQDTPVNVLNFTGRTIINYVPLFDSGLWSFHANVTVNSSSKVTLNATAAEQNSYIHRMSVKENANHTLKAKHNGKILLGFYNSSDALIAHTGWVTQESVTLLAPTGTAHARVTFSSTGAGTFTFENIMLNEGTTDQPFVANVKGVTNPTIENKTTGESVTLLGTFHEADIVHSDGTVIRKKKETVLDGSLNWVVSFDLNGGKYLETSLTGQKADTQKVVKFNGKILANKAFGGGDTSDKDVSQMSSSKLTIAVADIDSGWGETYTPTAEEIKAYFMGWRMANTSVGWDEPYNGTGTKGWYRIDDNGNKADGTNTLPTKQATINSKWQPYRLICELTTPETGRAKTVGSISLHEGDNQIEVSEGRIVRERAYPYIYTDGSANINHTFYPSTLLKFKTNKVLNVYENGEEFYGYIIGNDSSGYGNEWINIPKSIYDPTAVYEVDYIPLEPYKVSVPTNPIKIEYQGNIASVVSEVVKNLSELQEDVKSTGRTLILKDQELSNKLGDLNALTTANKNTLVEALNEVNNKPTGDPNDNWELITTKDFTTTAPLYSLYGPFQAYKRLKFVLKSLATASSYSGTLGAGNINLVFTGLAFTGYLSFGYRFNMMNGSPLASVVNATSRRTIFPLLGTNIANTTTYPHLELNGTIELNKSWWKSNQNYGFMPRRLWVDTELRVRDPNSSSMNRVFERTAWEFPIDLNENYPVTVGITTDRPQGFTVGTIEIWGVKGDANDV